MSKSNVALDLMTFYWIGRKMESCKKCGAALKRDVAFKLFFIINDDHRI